MSRPTELTELADEARDLGGRGLIFLGGILALVVQVSVAGVRLHRGAFPNRGRR